MSDAAEVAGLVGRTALWVAALRAGESERPDATFHDPWARALAPPPIEEELARVLGPVGRDFDPVILRTCFGDAAIAAAIADGARQVVLLGAGMDTRAFRLPLPADATIFEIERGASLDYKARVLAQAGARPVCELVTIAADLADDWPPQLERAGHDSLAATVWVIEGVLPYLYPEDVDRLMSAVTSVTAPGSVAVLDAYPAQAFRDPRMVGFQKVSRATTPMPRSTIHDPVQWAADHGWKAEAYTREDVARGDCPLAPAAPARVHERFFMSGWVVRARLARDAAALPG